MDRPGGWGAPAAGQGPTHAADPATSWFPPPWGGSATGGPPVPGQGQSAFAAPGDPRSGSAALPESWRLTLSQGARRLVALFLVLGAVVFVGTIVVDANLATSLNSRASAANAAVQIQSAHTQLGSAFTNFETTARGCNGNLSCVTKADAAMARAVGVFGQRLRAVAVPASAVAADGELESVTSQMRAAFAKLAVSASVAQYQQTVTSINIQAVLNKFDADYTRFMTALGA